MESVLKLLAVALPAGLLAQALRKDNPALSVTLVIGAAVLCLSLTAAELTGLMETLTALAEKCGLSLPALGAVGKTLGIALLTRLSVDILKDAGMNAAASATELAGSVAALWVTLPLMRALLETMETLL